MSLPATRETRTPAPQRPAMQQEVRATAPKRAIRPRGLAFLALVILPTLAAAGFYAFVASDRYVAEARLAVRQTKNPMQNVGSLVESLSAMMGPDLDTTNAYMVNNLVRSQNIVRDLDKDGALRRIFSDPAADAFSRFDPSNSDYKLWRYWQRMVAVYIDPVAGLVTIRAQAFRRQDALWIANAVLRKVENYVDEYDQRSRDETMRYAAADVARALEKDRVAIAAYRDYRDFSGKFNVSDDADANLTLLLSAWTQQIALSVQRAASASVSSRKAPTLAIIDGQIEALSRQIDELERKLTSTDAQAKTTSAAIARFNELEAKKQYADAIYNTARAGYESARVDAVRQQVYVMSYAPPSMPEVAQYPRRLANTALVFICALALWGMIRLTWAVVDNR